jgi:pyruvate/2-oxoglutarate dehydrogenase complex dihydrolipoamide dehydrogenase (E3) component
MKYDAIIIGSGQAGSPLSHKLADIGWKVALIEKEHLGGTCVNVGCTPTKTMVASAQVAHYARNAAKWGVRAANVSVDLPAVVQRKRSIVESFRGGHERNISRRPSLTLYRGAAKLVDARRIEVADQVLEGERIFINTGTRPAVPRIEGLEGVNYLTNASIMELTELPEHLVVLGGGYIGLEFGQMFRRFGSRVTVIHHGSQILPREDTDVIEELTRALRAEGMEFALNTSTKKVQRADGQVVLSADGPNGPVTLRGSHLLVATGRTPNTKDLGLDKAGVELDKSGFVKVNGRLETNVPGIWALGDVKGGPAFTHISYNDYQIVWANVVDHQSLSTDGRIVPYSVFTDPQLGGVGITEKEARQKGYKLKIGKIPMSYVARALERDETAGLMKIVVNAENDRILGASILSSEGGELVQLLGTLMRLGQPWTVLQGAIYIHPTLSEGFWSLMESVKTVG